MAIYRKDHVDPYLKELESYYWNVRRAVEGDTPSPNLAHQYHASPDEFAKHYCDIDMDRVERELGRFKATVDGLKQLKKKASKSTHRP
ncbi:hypothetical protein CWO84_10610 [Methylomonas sp. Kb3]|uniref:hypothetical protein n=1 Tax=Methylomonas sp. Kb3 TaxID=1611544 RepID=UPI000C334916|nr:hypothetical protein [Methylomonas sp. Kb3]PKD40434.1 hypothetical protein CWO84_10610 [Methylomonas sp. Kb3]